MSYQVKKKGGSVVMVKIDSADGQQRESYIGAIEPYTTKERLHELQTFNKLHADEHRVLRMQEEHGLVVKRTSSVRKREKTKIESKAFSKERKGFRMPKKSEPIVHGRRHILPRSKLSEKPHTEIMMERRQKKVKKDTITYNIKDLTRLQKLEAEIKTVKGILNSKKSTKEQKRYALMNIRGNQQEIRKITKGKHKSGLDIAKDRKEGKIIVVDDEGNTY